MVEAARAAAVRLAGGKAPPAHPGISGTERLLRPVIFRKARASVREKTGGHYPAPPAAIDVVEKGTAGPLARGLEIEARAFGALAVSDVSRALVSVFLATQEIKKDAGYPEGTQPREVRKLAVVGAGLMGAGIATAAADAGANVRLKDTTFEALARGLRHAREQFEQRRRRGSLTRLEFERRMNRLSATIDTSGFGRADLVIEAVFEDLDLKRRVLADVEEAAG
jgi:3-hydroxyacyl-CoA dehydrogenase/enoyl-CoA hydratase/3-hydroxybutyryl-CoA epimerase